MAIKIIVADDVSEMREMVVKMLEMSTLDHEIVGSCENGEEVLRLLDKKRADIVLMDINMPVMNGLEATEQITSKFPAVGVVIMSVQHESEYLKKAMFAGAKAYIMKPIDMDELVETIQTTYSRSRATIKEKQETLPEIEGKVLSFFSAKGGVGNSFVALNTAITLASRYSKKVVFLDMDLRFGDIALMLNRQNDLTLQNLLDDADLSDMEGIKPYVFHMKEGLDVIFAPKSPEAAEYIAKERIEVLISFLKDHYHYVVVDLGVNFEEITLSVLDASDRVYVVSNQEVTGLKDTKICLKVMETLNYDAEKVKLIINMSEDRYGVTKTTVQKAFDYEIIGYLPEDIKLVRTSINTGIPLALSKNAFTKPFLTLCKHIVGE